MNAVIAARCIIYIERELGRLCKAAVVETVTVVVYLL